MTDPNQATRNRVAVWGVIVAAAMTIIGAGIRAAVFDRRIPAGVDTLFLPAAIVLGVVVVVAVIWLRKNWK